jgi:hypothetical protein
MPSREIADMVAVTLLRRHAGLAVLAFSLLAGCGKSEPVSSGGPTQIRQLTAEQYRNTIADILGADIRVLGRFDEPVRMDGLLAVGAARMSLSPASFEQFDTLARSISSQVVDPDHRQTLIPCEPAAGQVRDDSCAAEFLGKVGRLLFRRPLTESELRSAVEVAGTTAQKLQDFHGGLGMGLAGLLIAPQFILISERVTPDSEKDSAGTLDAYSKAARLSFFFWNTSPDDMLLSAAERGELDTKKGLQRQIDRLLESPRLHAGLRAFLKDYLGFDAFTALSKDIERYPEFTSAVKADAEEQTLRTMIQLLLVDNGDFRDVFTTRKTFMSRPLAMLNRVAVDELQEGGWTPYEFPEGDPRIGILSHASFVALHSPPVRGSATIRGKAIREVLLCQKVPDPPGDVDFSKFEDPGSSGKTARERLAVHATVPTCAGCHKIMDPIGLSLENFDGMGGTRIEENGIPIDTSGEFDGVPYKDVAGLARALHDSSAPTSCLVDRLVKYGLGRSPASGEREWISYLEESFAANGFRLPALLRVIASSDGFHAAFRPEPAIAQTDIGVGQASAD